jgi:hypothetical protein
VRRTITARETMNENLRLNHQPYFACEDMPGELNQDLYMARDKHENATLFESLAIGATTLSVLFRSRAFDLGRMLAANQEAVVSWFEQ